MQLIHTFAWRGYQLVSASNNAQQQDPDLKFVYVFAEH
jgi:hypothetical protein